MDNEIKCWCKYCDTELPPSHAGSCPKCGKIGKAFKASATVVFGIKVSANLRARQKQEGFKKFRKQIERGKYNSGDPRLKEGVELERIIDKERDEYHETVKDVKTGEVIRDIHEPLSNHKHRPK